MGDGPWSTITAANLRRRTSLQALVKVSMTTTGSVSDGFAAKSLV